MSDFQGEGEGRVAARVLVSIVCPQCGYDPFVERMNGRLGCARCGKEMSKDEWVKFWAEKGLPPMIAAGMLSSLLRGALR